MDLKVSNLIINYDISQKECFFLNFIRSELIKVSMGIFIFEYDLEDKFCWDFKLNGLFFFKLVIWLIYNIKINEMQNG